MSRVLTLRGDLPAFRECREERPHDASDILHISTTHAINDHCQYLRAAIICRYRDPHGTEAAVAS